MGYEIVLCKVTAVDITTRMVQLDPITYTNFGSINVKAGEGLKFASTHAPYTRKLDEDEYKIWDTPVGFVNYPHEGDIVLAAVWVTDVSRQDRLYSRVSQNSSVEVIIIAKVAWDMPFIDTYDNILGDRSGAKIHFNHGWINSNGYVDDQETDRKIFKPNGNVTQIGNRTVRIAGKKFLGFGIHSHLLGRNNETQDKTIVTEHGEEVVWKDMFTKDPTEDVYNKFLNESDRGSIKFLEPPCPEPSTLMDFHESGYKHLVETNGHVRTYSKGYLGIIGGFDGEGIDDAQAMSFDPENIPEPTALGDGELVMKFIGSSDISHFLMKNNKAVLECAGLSVNMCSTGLPTSLTNDPNIDDTDVDAGKFKIYVNGVLQFTFSADENEFTIENDVKIKGNIDITGTVTAGGKIKSTGSDVVANGALVTLGKQIKDSE